MAQLHRVIITTCILNCWN